MTLARILPLLVAAAVVGTASAAERPLMIDRAQSRIEIAVKATLDSFVGQLTTFEPRIVVAEDGAVTSAEVAFRFHDVRTGKEGRDKAMHKWQETERFPEGRFVLTALQRRADGQATATGRLTLHGQTQELNFPVSLHRDGPRYALDGDAPVDVRDYGLPAIRLFAVLRVDPVVHVRFHLQGTIEPVAAVTQARR